ncbi:MAG: HNH endonuclease signature motif containing protein, partial [Ilumatobacteraceae bacterium]
RRRREEVLLARAVTEIGRRGKFRRDGHRSVVAWCRARLQWSTAEAVRVVRNGAALARLAACTAAARAGGIGVAQLDDLGRLGANDRVVESLGGSDELFLRWSQRLAHREWRIFLQRWEALADADGVQLRHAEAHDERRAGISFVGEQVVVEAQGGTFDGAYMRAVLDRFVDAEFQADRAEAAARLGCDAEQVSRLQLRRSHRQRSFDALVAVFRAAATSSVVTRDPEPLLNIVVDDTTAERVLRLVAGDEVPPRSPLDARHYRCETLDGVPLPEESALASMLAGRLRRVLSAPDGHVIELGRSRRLFAGAARGAVMLGDRRCLWPGCTTPTHHCQSDHSVEWADGGVTSPWNGGRACITHNVFKSAHHYTVHRRDDGEWDVRRPDGRSIGFEAMAG